MEPLGRGGSIRGLGKKALQAGLHAVRATPLRVLITPLPQQLKIPAQETRMPREGFNTRVVLVAGIATGAIEGHQAEKASTSEDLHISRALSIVRVLLSSGTIRNDITYSGPRSLFPRLAL